MANVGPEVLQAAMRTALENRARLRRDPADSAQIDQMESVVRDLFTRAGLDMSGDTRALRVALIAFLHAMVVRAGAMETFGTTGPGSAWIVAEVATEMATLCVGDLDMEDVMGALIIATTEEESHFHVES